MARRVVKVPMVMQMEALECGAACLTMILAYYGRWITLEQARTDCGVSRDGSKAVNILKAARRYGLEAKGITCSVEALQRRGDIPCILFWNFCHFVVLTGFKHGCACINDPGRGQITISLDEFEKSFTGIALTFKKTDAFVPGGEPPDALGSIRKMLLGMNEPIAFIMLSAAIASLASIIITALGKVFLDKILGEGNTSWIAPLTAIMLVLAIITGVVNIVNKVYLMRIRGKIAVVASSRFMRHLLHLPVEFYSQRMVGDIQQRQSTSETISFALINQLAPVLINTIMLVFYLAIMLNYSVVLTLVGISTIVANAFIARYISRKRVNTMRSMAISNGKLYATTVGGIEMIETIKAAGAENGYFSRWAGYQAEVNESLFNTTVITEYVGAIPSLLTQMANIAVLTLGVWLIVQNQFTPGMLLAFQGFLSAFMSPVSEMIDLGQTVQEIQTQIERVDDVMRYKPDVPEGPEEAPVESVDTYRKLAGSIELDHVTFGYSPLEEPLIQDFNLRLEPGQWVALVGSSGCGKSTIAKLISGLYQPWSGEVRIDGIPLNEIDRPVLRGSLAVVDQEIVTFDDSISDNIKLWDESIEDFEVIMACYDADIHDEITSRDGGYSSRIMPGGSNFSGGQLQRLEIARVLAQDPTMIILDEATSALDAQTEEKVIQRIRDRGITCVVVAHRLSTIRDCDEIIVLDDGKVKERGTHEELMKLDGAYAELVRSS